MKSFITHELRDYSIQTGGFELSYLPDLYDRLGDELFEMHTHSYYEIIWFKEGGGIHTVDFVDYPVYDNTFFFISPGQLHQYDRVQRKGVVMMFNPEFMSDENTTEDVFMKYSIFNAYDSPPCIVINNEPLIEGLNRTIMVVENEMPKKQAFGHHLYMQSVIRIMLIVFQRNDGMTDTLNYSPIEEKTMLNITNNVHYHFIRFRQALEKEYRHLHNVKDYAELLGLGTKYLTTIVKECSHRTPLQLINERILLEAKRQLRFSNKMVKEIAFDLGYDDPSYFVKQFKRATGLLPTEFREM